MLYRSRTKRAKDKIWHVPGIVGVMADPSLTVSNQPIMSKMCESSYKALQLTYSQHHSGLSCKICVRIKEQKNNMTSRDIQDRE